MGKLFGLSLKNFDVIQRVVQDPSLETILGILKSHPDRFEICKYLDKILKKLSWELDMKGE